MSSEAESAELREVIRRPAVRVVLSLIGLAFVVTFYRWFWRQHLFSMAQPEDWGHAYLIPLISGYLLWQHREALGRVRVRPNWLGAPAMIGGIIIYFYFIVGFSNHMFQGYAMLISLMGLVLLVLGWPALKIAFLPIAYLGFGMKISEMVMLKITFHLQFVASWGAHLLLNAIGLLGGFEADRAGNVISVTEASGLTHDLNVAEACSGMRMVIAFAALGAAVALVATRKWWRRIVVFLSSIPVAIFLNVIRVTVLGLATMVDPELARGAAHTWIGTLLLIPGLGLFLLVVWVLNRVVVDEEDGDDRGPGPVSQPARRPGRPGLFAPAASVAIVIMGISALGMGTAISAMKWRLQKLPIEPQSGLKLHSLPTETRSWIRAEPDRVLDEATLDELGTRNLVDRVYREKNPPAGRDARWMQLHATYYTGMIDMVPHIPDRCFLGGGMQAATPSELVPLELDTSGWKEDRLLPEGAAGPVYRGWTSGGPDGLGGAVRVRLPRNADKILMKAAGYYDPRTHQTIYAGYFFIANGEVVADANQVRLKAFNLSTDYAYFAKVQFTSGGPGGAQSVDELAEMASGMLDELLGDIMLRLPDWVDVQAGAWPEDNPKKDSRRGFRQGEKKG